MTDNTRRTTRRRYLRAGAALLASGTVAGCTDVLGGSEEAETATETGAGSDSSTTAAGGGSDLPSLSEDASSYLSDAQNFDGDVADYTDTSEVTVENGAGARGMAFDPAAIAVSPGTTVTWAWTGRGGDHDVVAVNEFFESELVESSTKTFSQTFEDAGETLYNCSEHEDKGMKGVVVVV